MPSNVVRRGHPLTARCNPAELELFDSFTTALHTRFLHSRLVRIVKMKRKLNAKDVPEPIQQAESLVFADFGLDTRLLQAVNRDKFAAPTSIQQKAIPLALQGKDVLGKFHMCPSD